jgi:anhydro-N-acetylmuramic acid kinase
VRVIGVNSGTSYDGIDVAAVDLALEEDVLTLRLLGSSVVEYEPALRDAIGAVLSPNQITVADLAKLDTALGQAFARAAASAVDRYCAGRAPTPQTGRA